MPRLEGSMATSGVRGRRERLLLSANEVGTWGSVSLGLCLSASPLRSGWRGERRLWMPAKRHQCHLHSSLPRPPRRALWLQDGVRGCRVGGVTCIRFCSVGKITNGSEIAVPQSGSSLSNKCSHANRQSPHKPHGWCSPYLHSRSLMDCLGANTVCVALYLLLKWPVIDVMLFCFLHTNQLCWKCRDRTVKQTMINIHLFFFFWTI